MKNGSVEDGTKEGRPARWTTPEALWLECKAYFDEYEGKGMPLTMEMLAYKLDMDRHVFLNYAKKGDEFCAVIKKAQDFIVATATQRLQEKGSNVVGSIFYLKNRADFVDKRELSLDADVHLVSFGDVADEELDEADD